MKLSRHTMLAAVMMATGLVFTMFGSAHAQRATYRTVSGHGYGHGYPCPADCGEVADDAAPSPEQTDDGMGEDLPEVADLTSDSAFASASQSAAPFAIGDSLAPSVTIYDSTYGNSVLSPGGSPFKATHNNSAVPQSRVFFNYNYFHDGAVIANSAGTRAVSPQFYELGAEYAFWCNMASVQVIVPMNYGFENDQTATSFLTGNEFGNIQVALKTVLCQDECSTWTAGLGVDLPTADDFTIAGTTFENDVVTLAPYLAHLRSIGCDTFVQAFAQVSIPLGETDVTETGLAVDLDQPAVLYLDLSIGKWLSQDCCGNGLLALVELHYTDALSSDTLDSTTLPPITVGGYEMLNATIGASIYRNCWVVTPAVVLPILDDAVWDYEFAVQVNRRF